MAEIILTKNNFKREVIDSTIPVIVDFWATWCPPCKMLAPIIEEVSKEYEGKIKVGKVNVDEEAELANLFKISSIPTVIRFDSGTATKTTMGYMPKARLLESLGL